MGLDMYLRGKKYISPYGYGDLQQKLTETLTKYLGELPGELCYVEYEIGYWRKANHIHKWFVDKCQDGVDECQTTAISVKQLQELKALCEKVLATARVVQGGAEDIYEDDEVIENAEEIAALLPTQAGFFFGGTGYDGLYLADVRNTVAIVDKALKAYENGWYGITYRSSW